MQDKNRDFSVLKLRIIDYLKFKKISKKKFYEECGVSNGVLSQKNGLSEDNIMRFLSVYPDVNTSWFLRGEGEMLKQSAPTEHAQSRSVTELDIQNRILELEMQLRYCKNERMTDRESFDDRIDKSLLEQGRLVGKIEMLQGQLKIKEVEMDRSKAETEVLLISNGELKAELEELKYQASEMYQRLKRHNDIDNLEVNSLSA